MFKKIVFLLIVGFSFIALFLMIYQFHSKGFFNTANAFEEAGDVLGLFGFLILWWEFIIGIRPIIRIFFKDLSWTINVHKLIGEYGFILILLHPVLLMINGWNNNQPLVIFGFNNSFTLWVTVGTIAFVTLFIVWLTSAIVRENIAFRPWKLIHLVSYPLMFLVYFHSRFAAMFLTDPNLRTSFDVLFILFVLGCIYRFLFQLGIVGKAEYETKTVIFDTDDVIKLTASPKKKILKSKPGQYLYIQTSPFGEAHPFGISDYHPENNDITFGIKFLGKFSESLKDLKPGQTLLLDGPYGEFVEKAYRNKNNLVLIAGGIGLSPFMDVLEDIKLNPKEYKDIHLFYGNKNEQEIAFRKEIEETQKANPNFKCFNVLSAEKPKGRKYEYGFITVEEMNKHLRYPLSEYEYFLCGPPIMITKLEEQFRAAKIPMNRLHVEKFSF